MLILPEILPNLPLLEERGGFATLLFGAGVVFFGGIASGAGIFARATCSVALISALFGPNPGALAAAGPCMASAAITLVASSIAGGLTTFGAAKGFVFEDSPVKIGKRAAPEPLKDYALGLSHHYDIENHRTLNRTYGGMLDSHNTTIIGLTWIETLPTANHTGGPLEHLNMTHGRFLTLRDNGVIRTAVGRTDMMGQILESFNDFKSNSAEANPLTLKKRQTLNVNFLTYNTLGENMAEGAKFQQNFTPILNIIEGDFTGEEPEGPENQFIFDTSFVQSKTGDFASKFCLSAAPDGNAAGVNSIIVGEVYANQFGGVDANCQSA